MQIFFHYGQYKWFYLNVEKKILFIDHVDGCILENIKSSIENDSRTIYINYDEIIL